MTRSSSLQTILLAQLDAIFGLHPGFRPAHAKGAMLSGTFAPSPEARSLTRAPHVTRESTPVTVRFSDGTGLPLIPDNLPDANPRGLAIRFHLADRVHTDIVSHSTGRILIPICPVSSRLSGILIGKTIPFCSFGASNLHQSASRNRIVPADEELPSCSLRGTRNRRSKGVENHGPRHLHYAR